MSGSASDSDSGSTGSRGTGAPVYTIIVAHDPNLVIGRDGDLPWHHPEDLKHFKRTTMGLPLLMGRKTWESIGSTPLPGRPCYVLTSRKLEGVKTFKNIEDAKRYFDLSEYLRVFIAGGGGIYKQMMKHADEMIITEVRQEHDGDTFFPEYRDQIGTVWRETERTDHPDFVIRNYTRIT